MLKYYFKVATQYIGLTALSVLLLVSCSKPSQATTTSQECMTAAVFYEARDQSLLGQQMVFVNVMNRVRDKHWRANTICKVINQPSQYSYTLEPKSDLLIKKNKEIDKWNEISKLVKGWLKEEPEVPWHLATNNHYLRCELIGTHAGRYMKNMMFLGKVGDHCFFEGY